MRIVKTGKPSLAAFAGKVPITIGAGPVIRMASVEPICVANSTSV